LKALPNDKAFLFKPKYGMDEFGSFEKISVERRVVVGPDCEKTLLSLLKPRGFLEDSKTAFLLWDGASPKLGLKKISYRALRKKSYRVAGSLLSLGVLSGERVGILLPNIIEFPIAYFGILAAGCVAVPINFLYASKESPAYDPAQILKILKDAGIKTVIALDKFYEAVSQIKNQAELEKIVLVKTPDILPIVKSRLYSLKSKTGETSAQVKKDERVLDFKTLLKKSKCLREIQNKPKHSAVILYTSGTTGDPKGIVHTHESLMHNAGSCRKLVAEFGMEENAETFLAAAPYFHIMGLAAMLHTPLLLRAKTVLLPRPIDFPALVSAIDYTKPTGFVGFPGLYKGMLGVLKKDDMRKKRHDFSSLKICLSGAAYMDSGIQSKFEEFTGKRILIGYGMTEIGVTHCQRNKNNLGNIGFSLEETNSKIAEPDEEGLGELLVRSKSAMAGYWNKPEKTYEFFTADSWACTGDMAKLEKDGGISIVGRIDDDFIKLKSGEKLPLGAAEKILRDNPQVADAAVVGILQPNGNYKIKAFVVLRSELQNCREFAARQLFQYLRKLPASQIPDEIKCIDALPRNHMGKVLKKILRSA